MKRPITLIIFILFFFSNCIVVNEDDIIQEIKYELKGNNSIGESYEFDGVGIWLKEILLDRAPYWVNPDTQDTVGVKVTCKNIGNIQINDVTAFCEAVLSDNSKKTFEIGASSSVNAGMYFSVDDGGYDIFYPISNTITITKISILSATVKYGTYPDIHEAVVPADPVIEFMSPE